MAKKIGTIQIPDVPMHQKWSITSNFKVLVYGMRIIVFIFTFCCTTVFAQSYKGFVKDSLNQALPYANVIAIDSMGNSINGAITDEKGEFRIDVQNHGPFILKISFIGYQDWEKKIFSKDDRNLGTIVLSEIINQLDEVVLVKRKPIVRRKVDRLIFDVENSIVSSSGDLINILQKTPGVRLNGEKIRLIGKSEVAVLINGNLSQLTEDDLFNFLKSISSDDVTRIEVITNPPAKYQAEGNSGLINVILKKPKRDFFGGNVRSIYQQATFPSTYLNGGITYQKNRLSIFTNINSGKGSIEASEESNIFYPNQNWDTDTKIRYFTNLISGRAGIDYEVSDNLSIGVQYLGGYNLPDNSEKTLTNIIGNTSLLDSLLITTAETDGRTEYHSYNMHLKTKFDTLGKSMAIDLDYFNYKNSLDRLNLTDSFLPTGQFIDNSTDLFRNTSNMDLKTFTSGIDFEWPAKFATLGFGGRISFIEHLSDVQAFNIEEDNEIPDSDQSNEFEYKENIQALYFSMSKEAKKFDFKFGLRMEFTQTEGVSPTLDETNNNDYYQIFPTAYATYTLNDKNIFSVNYGKRINRPDYSDLNPFRWYSNPFAFTEGNPFLQPYFIDNIELSHLYNDNLNTSIYVSVTNNRDDQITLVDPLTNIQSTIRANFLNQTTIGYIQSYTFQEFDWFESYLQFDLNYTKIKSNIPNTISEQEGFNFFASMDNSFFFNANKTFLGEINFWYSAPGVDGVDFVEEIVNVDFGLRCLFLKKRLQIGLLLNDVFRTQKDRIRTITDGIEQTYSNYYDARQLRISARYLFGNEKLKSKRKNFSNEEERKRAN